MWKIHKILYSQISRIGHVIIYNIILFWFAMHLKNLKYPILPPSLCKICNTNDISYLLSLHVVIIYHFLCYFLTSISYSRFTIFSLSTRYKWQSIIVFTIFFFSRKNVSKIKQGLNIKLIKYGSSCMCCQIQFTKDFFGETSASILHSYYSTSLGIWTTSVQCFGMYKKRE